jgi:hypothetical protein
MIMPPRVRKLALTAHLTVSVGWTGAVVAYLALGVAAATSQDAPTVRAAWIAMELTGWYVIVPLALASLLTGLVMALGTKWGLFRHYWVLFSLVLTILATVVLLTPSSAASSRLDQCVTPSSAGGRARVAARISGRRARRTVWGRRAVAGQPGQQVPHGRSGAARRSPSVGRCPAARRSRCWRRPQPPAEGSWPAGPARPGLGGHRPSGEGWPGRQGDGEGSSNRHGQNPVVPSTNCQITSGTSN